MISFKKAEIPDIILIEPKVFGDERGFFMETFKFSEFTANGIADNFVQDNHSKSARGVLRGLHYQEGERAQAKLVRCIRGEIFDVAVDMRKDSPTYLKWVGIALSEANKLMLYIPAGFAHGFCVISDEAEMMYKCSKEYDSKSERGVMWNDPALHISWPIKDPLLSPKDQVYPRISDSKSE